MDGKEDILTGKTTPFATIVSEPIAMDMCSQGMTSGQSLNRRRRRRKTNLDWHSYESELAEWLEERKLAEEPTHKSCL
jgi:hypothetical protein